jgi:hypothetical protein
MDKKTVKEVLRQFISDLEADGYAVGFAGMPPVLPEYKRPYKLQVYSKDLLDMGITKAITFIVFRMFDRLPLEIRHDIVTRTQVCQSIEDINCREEDIIINQIDYEPLTLPYQFLEYA